MSASTDQKVRELVGKLRDFKSIGAPPYEFKYVPRFVLDESAAATLITQAIAVETAVLREALELIANKEPGMATYNPYRMQEIAKAALSALPSPGAKAEDTASAENNSCTLKVGGKPFVCECGCNVFHRLPGESMYGCNSCPNTYQEEQP